MTFSLLKASFERIKQIPTPFRFDFLQNIEQLSDQEIDQRVPTYSTQDLRLYDAHQLEQCPWPQNIEGEYARRFLTPMIKRGVSTYIENIQTDLRVLVWDDLVLPISINETEYENSYVCSPYSYYISYAKESLKLLTQKGIYHALNTLLWGVSKVLNLCQVNKVVVVNNWFYSTNLYPSLKPQQLVVIAEFLQNQFPDHAIIFRSIDPCTSATSYQTLQQIDFDYIASRQIFFIDSANQSALFESRLFKSDQKLLKNSGYEIIDGEQLIKEDLSRVLGLYRDLYIHKYSDLNPQFTEDFLRLVVTEKLMNFQALKKDGRIDGVVGYIQRNGMMFSPFFGYDRTIPQETALYRLLCTLLMLEAKRQNLFFHLSSGASTFKKIRKAHSCIEYMAVYHRHLSFKRRIPWLVLKNICNSLGIIYMKRY